MKRILVFKSGNRVVQDSMNIVLNENPMFITQKIDLDSATDEEINKLKKNPRDKNLIGKIQKRRLDIKPQ